MTVVDFPRPQPGVVAESVDVEAERGAPDRIVDLEVHRVAWRIADVGGETLDRSSSPWPTTSHSEAGLPVFEFSHTIALFGGSHGPGAPCARTTDR